MNVNPNRAALVKAAGVVRSFGANGEDAASGKTATSARPWRNDAFLTVAEAAGILGMSRAVLSRWLRRGKVRGFRLNGSRWRVRLIDLLQEVPPKGEQRHAAR